MIYAVVPAQNEEKRIGAVLRHLLNLKIDNIVVILNGSRDNTLQEIKKIKAGNLEVIFFRDSLGIDVPRALGAKYAYSNGAHHVLFVDGDMVGDISNELHCLIQNTIKKDLDLGMTNCYPNISAKNYLTRQITFFRQLLNREIGLLDKIGISIPSHGPHMVSRRLLTRVPFEELAVPPVEMVLAYMENLSIGISVEIPHCLLGSSIKNYYHNQMITRTIAGDCLEALSVYQQRPRSRVYKNFEYVGYHRERRWDMLANFLPDMEKLNIQKEKHL